MKKVLSLLIIMTLLASTVLIGGATPVASQPQCTEELKACPDGTNVARNPARNCEFDPCSREVACTTEAKLCPDGTSYVGRNPLKNCEFNPCPSGRNNCGQSCEQTYERCKADAQLIEMVPGEDRDRAIRSILQECERSHTACLNACPKASVPPAQKSCEGGCYVRASKACVPVGTRVRENDVSSYCGQNGKVEAQKADGADAQNSYECLGNFASDGECVAVKEQLNLLQRIFNFFKRLFGGN